ncbi:hypothetical protein [Yeosuana aromativorans]|nr:hypothetical protein [Yeosuana aromativorans]
MKQFVLLLVFISFGMQSQTKLKTELPYYEIPDYPESFTAGSVAARMLDGLGFRYYWATEGLRIEDLAFRPNDMARTTAETIDHIYGLSQVIVNATLKKSNDNNNQSLEMSFEEKRKQTLQNIKTAADILRTSDDISQFKLIFGTREFPFWNNLNGPIEDAVWHCGQIVSFRRSSGNPYNSKASVFTGKVKN